MLVKVHILGENVRQGFTSLKWYCRGEDTGYVCTGDLLCCKLLEKMEEEEDTWKHIC
jgi:hypothetical protein